MQAHRIALMTVAVLGAGSTAGAQTSTQLLQKGIHTEETAGDLVGAVRIYRQIVEARFAPREVSAQAQLRLGEVLARLGRIEDAERELDTLVREHPEYQTLVRRVANRGAAATGARAQEGCCGVFSGNYDESRVVTVRGKVIKTAMINPLSVLSVEGSDGNTWSFTLASPNALLRMGFNRNTMKLLDEVSLTGLLAKGEGEPCAPDRPVTPCATFTDGSIHAIALTIALADGRIVMDRAVQIVP